MRFPTDFLDELRARLPVSDVVGRRVALKKAGREWKGLSPFNAEKTPSFFVNDQKERWFDFSSGKNGNIFDFVMLTEGLGFPEAVERLAQQAGMAVPQATRQDEARERQRRTLHQVLDLAATFFTQTLASSAGARARGYLADRGLDPALQARFRLGYAPPDRFALKEALGKAGVPVEDMVDAGLLIAGEDIPVPYDRFRDRVMFPIGDARGRVIAFGGRALAADAQAKYLNSPETALFHKGANLYNLATARAAAHKGAPVIAVEGYVDVIALVSAGYEAAVAPLGTALTNEQLGLLWKMADEPVLCFDGDGAGRRAAYKAADLALPLLEPGKSLRFASLPDGQDPDDIVRSGGAPALEEVLASARPLAQVLWSREAESGALDTPERRAALEARLAAVAASIGNETVRRHYRAEFDNRLNSLFQLPGAAGRGRTGRRDAAWPARGRGRGGRSVLAATMPAAGMPYVAVSPQLAASAVSRGNRSAVSTREALILQAVLNHPWLLHDHLEELSAIAFRHPDAERVKTALVDIAANCAAATPEELAAELDRAGLGPIAARIQHSITSASVWGTRREAAPEDVLMTWTQLIALHRQWHSLIKELREAELALGREATEANYSWLQDVKRRLADMDGTEALIEGFGTSSGRPTRSL